MIDLLHQTSQGTPYPPIPRTPPLSSEYLGTRQRRSDFVNRVPPGQFSWSRFWSRFGHGHQSMASTLYRNRKSHIPCAHASFVLSIVS